MKGFVLNILVLVLLAGTAHLSNVNVPNHVNDQLEPSLPQRSSPLSTSNNRFKRQDDTTTTTTTPKPKKHRPSNIFNLISVLISETKNDTNRAFGEIGALLNSQFSNETTTTTTTTTTIAPETSDDDENENVTTTTTSTTQAPFRITRDEFFGILRSNVQGIVNLFGREFKVAIKDSNQNVREFGRDLGNALAPYFTNNNTSTKYKKYH